MDMYELQTILENTVGSLAYIACQDSLVSTLN